LNDRTGSGGLRDTVHGPPKNRELNDRLWDGNMQFMVITSLAGLDSDFKDPNVINVRTPGEARRAVHDLKLEGVDFIKVMSNLNPDVYEAVAKQSKAEGLLVWSTGGAK
jgi:hypothetical protein